MGTFGDALILDGRDTDKGSNLRNEAGGVPRPVLVRVQGPHFGGPPARCHGLHGVSSREANYKALEGDNFTGKFARFWERVGVPIEQEPKPWDAMACERCCLCRTPTRWWTTLSDRKPGEQVALCEGCALTATPATIPTKRAWCDKERALNPRPYWGRSPWTFQGKEPS